MTLLWPRIQTIPLKRPPTPCKLGRFTHKQDGECPPVDQSYKGHSKRNSFIRSDGSRIQIKIPRHRRSRGRNSGAYQRPYLLGESIWIGPPRISRGMSVRSLRTPNSSWSRNPGGTWCYAVTAMVGARRAIASFLDSSEENRSENFLTI